MPARAPELWAAVDGLVDRAAGVADLRTHRVHLLAARRWRALGRPVPADLERDERTATVAALTAPVLLQRVREACEGPLVLLKGPELAAHYPDAALRPYGDIDLLVPDPRQAQRALVAAGFIPIGNPRLYVDCHHERPLAAPGLPLHVELHGVPKWPDRVAPPRPAELFEAAVPCSLAVEGVSTLAQPHHALALAAHSWAHEPLRRLGELVDIAAVSEGIDRRDLDVLAARWGLRRIWATTTAAATAVLEGGRPTWPLRVWARHLPAVRDRTVLEAHVEHWLSGFWAFPARQALGVTGGTLFRELLPSPGETFPAKLARMRLAMRNARVRRSYHEEAVEVAGMSAPHSWELDRGGAD